MKKKLTPRQERELRSSKKDVPFSLSKETIKKINHYSQLSNSSKSSFISSLIKRYIHSKKPHIIPPSNKEVIYASINKELLNQFDSLLKENDINNRSYALTALMEYFIDLTDKVYEQSKILRNVAEETLQGIHKE